MTPPQKELVSILGVGMRARLEARRKNRVIPDPPPRYDDVWSDGVRWLDDLAGVGDANERKARGLA